MGADQLRAPTRQVGEEGKDKADRFMIDCVANFISYGDQEGATVTSPWTMAATEAR
jgi:hypothetical protein